MKHLLILLSAFCFSISAFAQSAALAADLQSADAEHWPAINKLLIAQRNELTAAHLAALKAVHAKQAVVLKAAQDAQAAAAAAMLAAQAESTRLKEILAKRLAVESAENTRLKLASGPAAKALQDILTEAAKPEVQREVETLEAEQAALVDKLKAAKARLK